LTWLTAAWLGLRLYGFMGSVLVRR
jgi:hypothetical protein